MLPIVEHRESRLSPRVTYLYPEKDPVGFVETVLAGTMVYLPMPAESVLVVISDRAFNPVQFVCIGNLEAIEMVARQGDGKIFYNVVTDLIRRLEKLGKLNSSAVTLPLLSI